MQTWPSLASMNAIYQDSPMAVPCWQRVRFVDQASLDDNMSYEARIYFQNTVQTRTENWHDLFNFFTWLQWPLCKRALNQRGMRMYLKAPELKYKYRRGALNHLARFDECGLVIVGERSLLDMIREHQWKKLFIDHKHVFGDALHIHIFGHALYEKLLNPYVGLTGFAYLLEDAGNHVDDTMAHIIENPQALHHRCELQPFPLLGVPGMYQANASPAFYENKNYFRQKRCFAKAPG